VGAETLAAALAEARDAVEDMIEPYLLQQGYVLRTPRGRVAGDKAYLHLGLKNLTQKPQQTALFEE
jgi:Holliday junction DNA helicase RuvB